MVVEPTIDVDTLPSRYFQRSSSSSNSMPGPASPDAVLQVMTCCSGPVVVVLAHASSVKPLAQVVELSRASELARKPPVVALSRTTPSNRIDWLPANGPGCPSNGAGLPRNAPL